MGDSSPGWKKPTDVMKMLHKRKSKLTKCAKKLDIVDQSKADINKTEDLPLRLKRKRNPFSQVFPNPPSKRLRLYDKENKGNIDEESSGSHESEGILIDILNTFNKTLDKDEDNAWKKHKSSKEALSDKILSEGQRSYTDTPVGDTVPISCEKTKTLALSPVLPIDWSLKSKLRIVSTNSLQWCCQLRSLEESQGIHAFVQQEQSCTAVCSDLDQRKEFQKSCMYWMHPNLPWVSLFPRIVPETKVSQITTFLMENDIQMKLRADWEESFTSVFHQLRSGLCAYFYLCTHLFTVLFLGQMDSQSKMAAMVTPTTRGFRELLQNEGIFFTMPLDKRILDKSRKESTENQGIETESKSEEAEDKDRTCAPKGEDINASAKEERDSDEEGELLEAHEGASLWLESIGLDKSEFPSLDPRKVKLQREGFQIVDNRPESLVFMDGADVQALFNFLLNYRSCTATSGPQAGIPPTILAPSAFKGACLRAHKVKYTTANQTMVDGKATIAHIAEITGPILPDNTNSLVNLLHTTQKRNFGMVFHSHEPTAAFNLPNFQSLWNGTTDDDKEVPFTAKRKYSHFMTIPVSEDRATAIKEIVSSLDGFTWST
ncbi:hypothetical protein CHS0354_036785 [Potamilus streckersoni]|uniref:Protein downstream neighbor of Son n=1 Tax=Potamilus streckersoni TaxID=2493646 RepID=A0AAE0VPB1_9BIVA|nr:hypothetical protein CHS0354_036785 [Potamilus streckersoni]